MDRRMNGMVDEWITLKPLLAVDGAVEERKGKIMDRPLVRISAIHHPPVPFPSVIHLSLTRSPTLDPSLPSLPLCLLPSYPSTGSQTPQERDGQESDAAYAIGWMKGERQRSVWEG